jgi:hypothetical protein
VPHPDANAKPARVRIRMYRVGFGDCFLLSFEYAAPLTDGRSARHLLIDFGSTSAPRGQKPLTIAKLINQHTNGGELDVVVVSHRHKDHLSAFADTAITDLLAKPGFPKLVVRSWTENPNAKRGATGGAGSHQLHAGVGGKSADFLGTLDKADQFAELLVAKTPAASTHSLAGVLHQVADDQLRNADAVRRLRDWGKQGKASFVHYGVPSGIEAVVPGVSVKVLGPPTVDQHERVATQRSRDKDEFWMIYHGLISRMPSEDLGVETEPESGTPEQAGDPGQPPTAVDAAMTDVPLATTGFGDPGPVRWLTDRMGRQRLNSLLRIVRILDGVLNNTSVILLFDIPGVRPLRLLFPGDAQIENWEYALKFADDNKANLDLLRAVDLYKVGHHGSRNATPKTLYNLWLEPATKTHQMTALMSTKSGVHGESTATAVPRKTLVAALDTRMKLLTTQSLNADKPYHELVADCSNNAGLVEVPGP